MNWSAKQIQHFFDMTPIECFNIQEQKWRSTPSGKLRLGDRIRVGMGKMIPVDAVLQSPLALVSLSYINGEATPKHLCRGDLLKAGTINTSETVELEVHNCAQESYLGKVLRSVGENWRQRPLDAASVDQLAMPITLITLIIAAIGFFYGYYQTGTWEMAFQRFLTIAIVSCPCALGIAAPLTWMRALSLAAGKGIVIKDEKVLERIANVRSIFFDKTGTLSAGQINVRSITTVSTQTQQQIANILLAMENGNQHPIAVAIIRYIRSNYPESEATPMDKIWHVPGRGLEATAGQKHFQILSTPALSSDHKKLVLLEDNNPIAHLHVDEILQHDTKKYMTKLLPMVERIGILSGDNDEHVKAMSNTLGLNSAYSSGELSASDKQHFVDQQETPMMVGDGANDMLALSGKAVGVVVQGGLELSMQSSDVWLAKPGISGVWQMLILARNTKRVLRRNVILSITYNVITISLAFFGILSPLTAAILMPLSSLAVLLNTMAGPYFPKELRS
jgi:Cu2+-exporting ATPase/Cu+-exporting ATPase